MSLRGTITGPIAPYNNVPINPQYFQPSQFFISAIALGQTTIVTTTVNHNYIISQQVRLLIPQANGCSQLDEQTGYVISIPNANQVEININSSAYNLFQTSTQPTQPQIVAIGDISFGFINPSGMVNEGNYVPGAFINISPL